MKKFPECNARGCKRRAAKEGLCKTHLTQRKDRNFSLAIRARDERCMNCLRPDNLQCCHVISRRYRLTRWDYDNAVALCRNCHVFYTHRPLEWEDWVDSHLGDGHYLRMKNRALGVVA